MMTSEEQLELKLTRAQLLHTDSELEAALETLRCYRNTVTRLNAENARLNAAIREWQKDNARLYEQLENKFRTDTTQEIDALELAQARANEAERKIANAKQYASIDYLYEVTK